MSPQDFMGGSVWNIIVNIHGGLQAVGYGLLVLFFAMGIFKQAASFREVRRPEQAFKFLIRFLVARVVITYGMDIMLTIFEIIGGITATVAGNLAAVTTNLTVPPNVVDAIHGTGVFAGMGLLFISLIGVVAILVLSLVAVLTVYGRFFRLYIYTAIAPIPLSTFGGEGFSSTGKAFLKSYIGVCLEGAIIVLACIIYSAIVSNTFVPVDPNATEAASIALAYIIQVVFGMLILVGIIRGADRIVKEMMGL